MLTPENLETIKQHNLTERKQLQSELEILKYRPNKVRQDYIEVRLTYIEDNLAMIDEIKSMASKTEICYHCKRPL